MNCAYCGEDAGRLKNKHKHCQTLHDRGARRMIALAADAALSGKGAENLRAELRAVAADSYQSPSAVSAALAKGYINAAQVALGDHLLTSDEERTLHDFMLKADLIPQEVSDIKGGDDIMRKLNYSAALRDIKNGKVPDPSPEWAHINLPFNFMKSESPIWAFEGVEYLEDKTIRERVGGSGFGAVRVARGVYVGGSRYRSRTEEREATVRADRGTVAITNKHIYFSGARKKFRIRHDKIVAYDAYSDGLSITRDALNAKRQIFVVPERDAWLLCNMASMAEQTQ